MAKGYLCAALALVWMTTACAPGRIADLRDSASLGLGVGVGLSADLKAGALTHPALGTATASAMMGSDSRDVGGSYLQVSASDPHAFFFARRAGESVARSFNQSGWRAALEVKRFQTAFVAVGGPVGKKPTEVFVGEMQETELTATLDEGEWLPLPPELTFREATDLQAGATLLLFTARMGFNPLEFIDFLLGFGGLDIAGDDGT